MYYGFRTGMQSELIMLLGVSPAFVGGGAEALVAYRALWPIRQLLAPYCPCLFIANITLIPVPLLQLTC